MLRMFRLACVAFALPMSAPAVSAAEVVGGLAPVDVDGPLEAGLAVTYWRDIKFDLMQEMHQIIREVDGEPGPPVAQLATGEDVLTTDGDRLVAAVMKGVINFAKAGTYQLEFVSNDGILVALDGRVIHADPNRHVDASSGSIAIAIDEPGWYDLDIAYFQKKGTHRHDMFWSVPGGVEVLTLVPAAAFAHVPGTVPGFATMPAPDPADTVIR